MTERVFFILLTWRFLRYSIRHHLQAGWVFLKMILLRHSRKNHDTLLSLAWSNQIVQRFCEIFQHLPPHPPQCLHRLQISFSLLDLAIESHRMIYKKSWGKRKINNGSVNTTTYLSSKVLAPKHLLL